MVLGISFSDRLGTESDFSSGNNCTGGVALTVVVFWSGLRPDIVRASACDVSRQCTVKGLSPTPTDVDSAH